MVEFTQIQTFFLVLAAIFTFIVLADNAVERIRKWFMKPSDDISDLSDRLDAHDAMLDNDNKRINKVEEMERMTLRGINLLMAHEINGNDISKLQDFSHEVETYLINHA